MFFLKAMTGINHRNHITPQVDDAQYIGGRTRNRSNFVVTKDFLDLHYVDAVGFTCKFEGNPLQLGIFPGLTFY